MNMEKVIVLETVIDHLTGEELGNALEKLNALPEILDTVFLTGIGKKNRPSGLLQAMCRPENEISARDAVFRHTHALGLRRSEMERYVLPRREAEISVLGQTIKAKEHELQGRTYIRAEADAIAALASQLDLGAPAARFGSDTTKTN